MTGELTSREEGGEEFAIKIIRAARPKKRARFIQEIGTHVTLSSQKARNIIPVIDHNLEELEGGGVTGFVVMPLAMTTLEKERDALTGRVELCLELFIGIVNGICNAHQAGIVHRDIKPGNVLFLNRNLRDPQVSDFGICLLRDTPEENRLTEVGETVGAKYFMAPEQERGGVADISPSADNYGLGKLLHHMLTGRYLYREELAQAFTPEEYKSDRRYKQIHDEVLSKTIVESPTARMQTAKELLEIAKRLLGHEQGDGGGPPDESSQQEKSPDKPPPELGAFLEFSETFGDGNVRPARQEFDRSKLVFQEEWTNIHDSIRQSPREAIAAATKLIRRQPRATALLLAIGQLDVDQLFRPAKQFIELVLRSSENQTGYPAVFTVPHLQAGFLYMGMSVVALQSESWKILNKLLTEKFEWYYQSGRPNFSYGFSLSYFFHPEPLRRAAGEAHDFYRASLEADPVIQSMSLKGDTLLSAYLQVQFIMSLRVAQLVEKGEEARLWPDFGRFHGYRVEPVLQRAYHDGEYSDQLLRIFGETKKDFFSRLNQRLSFLREKFRGANYFWDSLESWEP